MRKIGIITILLTLIISACTLNSNFKIMFESNGGSLVESITAEDITSIIMPVDPVKKGHTFGGWYLDNGTFTVEFDFNSFAIQSGENELTVYANWIINEEITYITLGGFHSAGITSYGRIFIWGSNTNGQIGNKTTVGSKNPLNITSQFNLMSDEKITSVELGISHSAAITSKGKIFTWGWNGLGQLGDGTSTDRNAPTNITSRFNLSSGETIVSISISALSSGALTSNGRIFIWGAGGQIGDGTTTNRNTPTDITSRFNLSSNERVTLMSLGNTHSAALTSNGRIFMWGSNNNGQLGDGTTTNRNTPTDITSRFNFSSNERITEISLGNSHSGALTSNGRIFMWGQNISGQIGDGTTTQRITPLNVSSSFRLNPDELIKSIKLGGFHSSVLTSNGRVFTWGNNSDSGRLGDGTTTSRNTPTNITSGFNLAINETIIFINLGLYHSSAISSNGNVFTWGSNDSGQIGDNSEINRTTPTNITSRFNLISG
jgi:uncharacterized repeat protein (TIGR02543 family)